MSAYTDPLQLNEIPVFRQLKNNMPKNVKDTRNIIEIRDNVIYAWDAMEFSLLTLNLGVYRNKNAKITGYQR
ncbi:nuclear pore complex protein Nup88-like isoform X2 [Augochlora pura]